MWRHRHQEVVDSVTDSKRRSPSKRINSGFQGLILLLSLSLVMLTSPAGATNGQHEDIEQLRRLIQSRLNEHFQKRFPELTLGDNLIISTGTLDRRLQLGLCKGHISTQIKEPPHTSANVTVKTSCQEGTRWTIYVPGSVATFRDVVVAAHSLARGSRLEAGDLTYLRMNTTTLNGGHVEDVDRLLGMEVKRQIRASEAIKLNYIRQPDLISKGETVVLRVKSRVLTVETEGTALANGHLGEQIRVRNDHSQRIVDGLVMGPGEVQVASW